METCISPGEHESNHMGNRNNTGKTDRQLLGITQDVEVNMYQSWRVSGVDFQQVPFNVLMTV